MSINILKCKDKRTLENLDNCKSKSNITGSTLRKSHYELGISIANDIIKNEGNSYVVLVMMRAGLYYANGIADEVERKGRSVPLVLVNNDTLNDEDKVIIGDKKVIIVDAVINTGKSIFKVIDQLDGNEIIIATTVISDTSLDLFPRYSLYTTRISANKYIGAKVKTITNGRGPDTGDRLFNTLG